MRIQLDNITLYGDTVLIFLYAFLFILIWETIKYIGIAIYHSLYKEKNTASTLDSHLINQHQENPYDYALYISPNGEMHPIRLDKKHYEKGSLINFFHQFTPYLEERKGAKLFFCDTKRAIIYDELSDMRREMLSLDGFIRRLNSEGEFH